MVLRSYALFAFLLISLSGCMNAAVTSAQVVYDHHSIQQKFNNQFTSLRAYQKLYLDTSRYQDTHLAIITYNDCILLIGQVPDLQRCNEIENTIRKLAGTRKIYNYVEIAAPSSLLTRASDSWITTKIKTQLITADEVDATQIKVITENGTVYLIGTLPREQGDVAAILAQNTAGVQKIVKMFSYVYVRQT